MHKSEILARIQATYRQSLRGLMRPAPGVSMATYDLPGGRLGYAMLLPNIGDGVPYWIPAYDAMQTDGMLGLLHQQFGGRLHMVSPALDFDLRQATSDAYIRRIKTKKRWLFSDSISTQVLPVTPHLLQEFLVYKQRSYPGAHLTHEDYLQSNGYVGEALVGKVGEEWLFTILVYSRRQDYVASHVILTEDQELKKRYSPYVLAHAHALRHAEAGGASRLRCGSYYPYKGIFNVEPTYYPLIPESEIEACPNLFEGLR